MRDLIIAVILDAAVTVVMMLVITLPVALIFGRTHIGLALSIGFCIGQFFGGIILAMARSD
jgi:hypothetical protein